MERKRPDSNPDRPDQHRKVSTPEPTNIVSFDPQKARIQSRFLKYSSPKQTIRTQFGMPSLDLPATTPIFSTPEPVVNREELSPSEVLSTTAGIDPQVLEILAEERNKASVSYHHLETTYIQSSPFAPRDTMEDDYSEESRP